MFGASSGRSEVAEVCVLAAHFFLQNSFQGLCILRMPMQRSRGQSCPCYTSHPFSDTTGALFADCHSSSQLTLLAVNTKSLKCTLQIRRKKKKALIIFHVDRINQDVIMTPNEIT